MQTGASAAQLRHGQVRARLGLQKERCGSGRIHAEGRAGRVFGSGDVRDGTRPLGDGLQAEATLVRLALRLGAVGGVDQVFGP